LGRCGDLEYAKASGFEDGIKSGTDLPMKGEYEPETLSQLLEGEALYLPSGGLRVRELAVSSRQKTLAGVFVAVKGTTSDGHNYIREAFSNGCVLAVVSRPEALEGRSGIFVADTREALSRLSALFSGYAARELVTVGLTGTNGKTTVNWLVCHMLRDLGEKALRIGTLGVEATGVIAVEGNLTTPDPIKLHHHLREAVDGGVRYCVIEASSHALDQRRVDDLCFDVGVFTNLTRDHLDYHADMESYFAAKARLFELMARHEKGLKTAVINLDSPHGRILREKAQGLGLRDFSFGSTKEAVVRLEEFTQEAAGSRARISFGGKTHGVESGLIGAHNGQNLCAAFAVGVALGFEAEKVARALEQAPQVPGRLEAVRGRDVTVFVDYAHTPDALQNALLSIRALSRRNLWVIFGCGGDRDRGKRPEMGKVAVKYADRVVVTSDNPRTEDPQVIIDDILASGIKPEIVDADRRKAIYETISRAGPGDVILLAGKGHENYQIIGGNKRHFSDVEEAGAALRSAGRI